MIPVFLLAAMAAISPASVDTTLAISPEHQPENLSRLLHSKDYTKLGAVLTGAKTGADVQSNLDWGREQMMSGASAFVTIMYARDLLRMAVSLAPEGGDPLRETASMALLYAYAAISIDGTRCGDASAPERRLDQVLQMGIQTWPFLKALPVDRRKRAVDVALKLEKRTAAKRTADGDDEFLCRYGLEETTYNLRHGTQHEVPPAAGQYGRTIKLKGDGKYRPSIRPPEVAAPKAAEARAALPETLSKLAAATE